MKAYDFEAVTYDGAVYCTGCLPDGVDADSEGVYPIFADSEWDSYPVCDACGAEHDYMSLTSDGQSWLAERKRDEFLAALTEDPLKWNEWMDYVDAECGDASDGPRWFGICYNVPELEGDALVLTLDTYGFRDVVDVWPAAEAEKRWDELRAEVEPQEEEE